MVCFVPASLCFKVGCAVKSNKTFEILFDRSFFQFLDALMSTKQWGQEAVVGIIQSDMYICSEMILLLNAYRAGSECRLSQADAAWVRNVISDAENFLPQLLHQMQ